MAIVNHLLFHVWEQLEIWGPAYTTWMYVTERFMSTLTRLVRNRAAPEVSLTNAYSLAMSTVVAGETIKESLVEGLQQANFSAGSRLVSRLLKSSLQDDTSEVVVPAVQFPKWRNSRARGMSKALLTAEKRQMIAAALSLSPQAVAAGVIVDAGEILAEAGNESSRIVTNSNE